MLPLDKTYYVTKQEERNTLYGNRFDLWRGTKFNELTIYKTECRPMLGSIALYVIGRYSQGSLGIMPSTRNLVTYVYYVWI